MRLCETKLGTVETQAVLNYVSVIAYISCKNGPPWPGEGRSMLCWSSCFKRFGEEKSHSADSYHDPMSGSNQPKGSPVTALLFCRSDLGTDLM